MALLIRAAEERGIERMEGLVLTANRNMLGFARALGFKARGVPEEPGETRVVKRLHAPRAE